MNLIYIIATAATVSIDSFIAGFSLSLNTKKSLTLPLTVAAVTYILCEIAALLGILLKNVLQNYVGIIGGGILIALGIVNLFKKENITLSSLSFSQCFAIGVGVGFDGAAACLSLVLQGIGDRLFTPIFFAVTHFATVFLGQRLAQSARVEHANVISACMFFVLAGVKIFGG